MKRNRARDWPIYFKKSYALFDGDQEKTQLDVKNSTWQWVWFS